MQMHTYHGALTRRTSRTHTYNTHPCPRAHSEAHGTLTRPDLYSNGKHRPHTQIPAESIHLQSFCLWLTASASLPSIYVLDVYSSHTHSHPPTVLTTHSAHSNADATNTFPCTQTYVPLPFSPCRRAPARTWSLGCLLTRHVCTPTYSRSLCGKHSPGQARAHADWESRKHFPPTHPAAIDMQHLSCL